MCGGEVTLSRVISLWSTVSSSADAKAPTLHTERQRMRTCSTASRGVSTELSGVISLTSAFRVRADAKALEFP